jgi:hypothetical protein
MKKRIVSILIAVLLLTGCSVSSNTNARPQGIQIIQMDTSIGGSEGNANQQVISYDFTLYNGESVDIVVHWIEPVLVGQLSERVINGDRRVQVEKTVSPNSSLEITGKFTFETKGATKAEITSWEPIFTGFNFSTEMTLPPPGSGGK